MKTSQNMFVRGMEGKVQVKTFNYFKDVWFEVERCLCKNVFTEDNDTSVLNDINLKIEKICSRLNIKISNNYIMYLDRLTDPDTAKTFSVWFPSLYLFYSEAKKAGYKIEFKSQENCDVKDFIDLILKEKEINYVAIEKSFTKNNTYSSLDLPVRRDNTELLEQALFTYIYFLEKMLTDSGRESPML